MFKYEFIKLKEMEDEDNLKELDVGEKFLYGINLIMQKQNKKIGEPITYYEIIRKSNMSVEYMPIYDFLEKGEKGE